MHNKIESNLDVKTMKILFVDDETSILKSIKRGFFLSDFEIFTADNAKKGLEIIKNENIDIVVSDYRMPEMDGIKFLSIVKEKYPSVSRIILSGFVEHSSVIKSISKGVASTYFAKPWEDVILENRISHIFKVRDILNSKSLLDVLNSIEKLPTLPTLYQDFMDALEADKSMQEISEIIEENASVAAKVLQVANSAFYGMRKVLSVENAITYLGLTLVKDIVLTVSFTDSMIWDDFQVKQLQYIFSHSSLVNRYIPKFYKMTFGKESKNQLPSVGLTHDIGKLILLQYYPDRYKKIITNMQEHPGITFYESEIDLGYQDRTHCEIGAYFLDWWNLPEIIVEVALFHHTPEKSTEEYRDLMKVSQFTDNLLNYLWYNQDVKELDISQYKIGNFNNEEFENIVQDIRSEFNENNK